MGLYKIKRNSRKHNKKMSGISKMRFDLLHELENLHVKIKTEALRALRLSNKTSKRTLSLSEARSSHSFLS
jgi:hypothetical protein